MKGISEEIGFSLPPAVLRSRDQRRRAGRVTVGSWSELYVSFHEARETKMLFHVRASSSETSKCKVFHVYVFVRSGLFFLFWFKESNSAGGITALLLVEAIRYGNTLNLSVVFCAFFLASSSREFLFRLSRRSFWGLLRDIAVSILLGNRGREMWRELFRVSGKAESNQPGPLTPSPAPLGLEPLATPTLLRWKPAMKPFVWCGALQALGDLHTNPLCDNTQISGLQTWGWWVCYKCLDR